VCSPNIRKERLSETLKALVESCSSPHPLVAHTALEAVSSLISSSEGLERINAVDPVIQSPYPSLIVLRQRLFYVQGLVSYIIESLSDDIIIAISTIKVTHEPLGDKGVLFLTLCQQTPAYASPHHRHHLQRQP